MRYVVRWKPLLWERAGNDELWYEYLISQARSSANCTLVVHWKPLFWERAGTMSFSMNIVKMQLPHICTLVVCCEDPCFGRGRAR